MKAFVEISDRELSEKLMAGVPEVINRRQYLIVGIVRFASTVQQQEYFLPMSILLKNVRQGTV